MKLVLSVAILQGILSSYASGCTFTVTTCDFASVKSYLTANPDECTTTLTDDELQALIDGECDGVEQAKLEWTDVTTSSGNPRNYQWDDNYFDGGTSWNDEKETATENLMEGDSGSIARTWKYHASTKMIGWPTDDADNNYGKNWENCESRVGMCCFTGSRMGKELPKNADVCAHDMKDSKTSNHINKGFSIFKDSDKKAYCTAFAWEADETSISARYKGNALFYASMYDGLYVNGFVENIPSSPMCACVEQMATVTASDCVEVKATESGPFKVKIDDDDASVEKLATVTYQKCDAGDLVEHYKTVASDEEVTKLTTDHIVADCESEKKDFANDRFYVPGDRGDFADMEKWTLIVGKGKMYSPPVGETAFREAIAASPNNIIRRICLWCDSTHKDIYYQRLTPIPPAPQYDFLANFMDDWFDTPNNKLGEDFNLYSSYEDALAGVGSWTFCNYNDNGVGFPRDCGPTGRKNHNWNSYRRSNWRTNHHAFYVEKATASSES